FHQLHCWRAMERHSDAPSGRAEEKARRDGGVGVPARGSHGHERSCGWNHVSARTDMVWMGGGERTAVAGVHGGDILLWYRKHVDFLHVNDYVDGVCAGKIELCGGGQQL